MKKQASNKKGSCIQKIDTSRLKFNPEDLSIIKTKIAGLLIIKRPYFGDKRGGFQEDYRIPDILKRNWESVTILQSSVSDMCVGSRKGIHCERQEKLITFNAGEFFIVEVDIRSDSPTFTKHVVIKMNLNTATNPLRERVSLAIPKGVGNSMQVIQPRKNDNFADISYQVSEVYGSDEAKRVIKTDDPVLGINWPKGKIIVSDRDKAGYNLNDFVTKFRPDYTGLYKFK